VSHWTQEIWAEKFKSLTESTPRVLEAAEDAVQAIDEFEQRLGATKTVLRMWVPLKSDSEWEIGWVPFGSGNWKVAVRYIGQKGENPLGTIMALRDADTLVRIRGAWGLGGLLTALDVNSARLGKEL
jgi:hypothetical protein